MKANQMILDGLKALYTSGRLTEEKLASAIERYELTPEQVGYIKGN